MQGSLRRVRIHHSKQTSSVETGTGPKHVPSNVPPATGASLASGGSCRIGSNRQKSGQIKKIGLVWAGGACGRTIIRADPNYASGIAG